MRIVDKTFHAARHWGRAGLDVLMPPLCPVTGTLVDEAGTLSPSAWAGLRFITPPRCAACGLPFDYDVGDNALCAACLAKPPKIGTTRSALVYNDVSRALILALKHGGRTDGVSRMAGWMTMAGRDILGPHSLILPVPLHFFRRIRRRFNQSALLGRAIARQTGAPFAPALLRRTRATSSQAGRNARARQHNVAGAFTINPRQAARIKGAHIVLIDDVRTTGATLHACARPLIKAGAARIDALTLARVVKTADQTT